MDHGYGKHIKDTEVTVKTEVEEAVASILFDANYVKEEPGLGQLVKIEPAWLVVEGIPGDCTQGTSTLAYADSVNEACKSLGDLLNVKYEPNGMDIGPTVLQHMDTHYEINQNTSAVKEENTVVDDGAAIPCKRRKKESVKDKLRGTGGRRGAPARFRKNVARDSVELQFKEEDADLDIGPTVLQHMDSHYRADQIHRATLPICNEEVDGILTRRPARALASPPPPSVRPCSGAWSPQPGTSQLTTPWRQECERRSPHHEINGGRAGGDGVREVFADTVRMQTDSRAQKDRGAGGSGDNNYESEDYFYDVEGEARLFGGERSALNFDWAPMGNFQGSQESFLPETTGPVADFSDIYDAFRNFWDDDILQHIVVETNRYAAQRSSQMAHFANGWVDTNVHEILILFAFWMMLGVHGMPSIKSCFTVNYLLKTEIFLTLFTEERYRLLSRALHFYDNSTRNPQSSKLICLGPVLEHLNSKFMSSYTPGQDILIDKSLTLLAGKESLRGFVRTKEAKFGIMTFKLCDASSGYLWSFKVYTESDSGTASSSGLPKSTQVVLDLISPLLHKGYRLFMDKLFNSPILARYLKRHKTDCVGTLSRTRRNVAPVLQHAKLPEGHFVASHAGDVVVMVCQDKKPVCTISTYHGNNMVQIPTRPGGPAQYKPSVIVDYNRSMIKDEKKDKVLEPYLEERKMCSKWYMNLFKRLLDVSILNSMVLIGQSSRDQAYILALRLNLVEKIIKRHLSQVPVPQQGHYS